MVDIVMRGNNFKKVKIKRGKISDEHRIGSEIVWGHF